MQQQQQPPPPQMMPVMPPANTTTEQIQKYLEENKKLILAIMDNQNLGKLSECAQYQNLLQKNLMYLAAIADAQPQAPTVPAQMAPHPGMQAGGFPMQRPQAGAMAQQPGMFPQKLPMQFNNPHQLQQLQQHQHQHHQQAAIQGQMGMRVGGANGMHPLHTEATLGGGSGGVPPPSGRSKQDASEAGHGGGDGDSSYKKGAEDAK